MGVPANAYSVACSPLCSLEIPDKTFRNLWLVGEWQKKSRLAATNHNIRFMPGLCQGQRMLRIRCLEFPRIGGWKLWAILEMSRKRPGAGRYRITVNSR